MLEKMNVHNTQSRGLLVGLYVVSLFLLLFIVFTLFTQSDKYLLPKSIEANDSDLWTYEKYNPMPFINNNKWIVQ